MVGVEIGVSNVKVGQKNGGVRGDSSTQKELVTIMEITMMNPVLMMGLSIATRERLLCLTTVLVHYYERYQDSLVTLNAKYY